MKSKTTPHAPGEIVIQFIGKRQRFNLKTGKESNVPDVPPARIINGDKIIDLPSPAQQRIGFAHADAKFLLKNYRSKYKRKTVKGKV